MDISLDRSSVKKSQIFKYLFLAVAGVGLIMLCSLFQRVPSVAGEYHYSTFFGKNYLTVPAITIFFISGLAVGYFWNLNPWISSLSLYIVFPITTLVEGTIYRGSHNLLPFEFIIFFCYAIPCIVAIYIGRFLAKKSAKQKFM